MKNTYNLYDSFKEKKLNHRYIFNDHILSLINKLPDTFDTQIIGHSVNKESIFGIKVGKGKRKVLMWSQMHGNESTTTKALFDLFNYLKEYNEILEACTLFVIPILNPDGAKAYTRVNANNIDLNRDAQNLSQPESKTLRKVFNEFQPDFCFNLHGQRTIFSAGATNNSATVSFLSPAQDYDCIVTNNRKISMEIISEMNKELQKIIPNQIGVYDDTFNINCVGDTFQSLNIPTVLFEAGHYRNDYSREETRKFIFTALVKSLEVISNNDALGMNFESYFDIPENKKLFFDIIIRNILYDNNAIDVAVQYEEVLKEGEIKFIPKVKEVGDLSNYFAHRDIDANKKELELPKDIGLEIGNSIDFVIIGGVNYSLNLIKF